MKTIPINHLVKSDMPIRYLFESSIDIQRTFYVFTFTHICCHLWQWIFSYCWIYSQQNCWKKSCKSQRWHPPSRGNKKGHLDIFKYILEKVNDKKSRKWQGRHTTSWATWVHSGRSYYIDLLVIKMADLTMFQEIWSHFKNLSTNWQQFPKHGTGHFSKQFSKN